MQCCLGFIEKTLMVGVFDIKQHLRGDRAIWMITFMLGAFSLLAVYSASGSAFFRNHIGNTEFALVRQLIFITLGLALTYICYSLDYMKYARVAPILLAIAVPLLFYTLFFTESVNGSRRWAQIPWLPFSLQTSDVARFALIIFIARALSIRQDFIKDFKHAFLPVIIPITLVCMLIFPANLSTSILLFITCILMMFIGRVSMRYISIMILIGLFGFIGIWMIGGQFPELIRVNTWSNRFAEFWSGGGDQIVKSKIAIAEGGRFGVGPGESFQRNYLAYCYADFIYAIICEEYGILGGVVILGLYLGLLFRCISIVTRCPKAFGAILAMGLCLNIVIQAFANIAVSVDLVPVTGLTLPLVSMGGTSILFTCMSLGIILSVSRYVEEAQLAKVELTDIEKRDADTI